MMSENNAVPAIANAPSDVTEVATRIRTHLSAWLAAQRPDFNEPMTDHMSFDYIGLDSVARVDLISALEKEFQIKLDPTAAYDFVTVGALAEFVWSEISGIAMDMKKTLGV